MNSRCTIVRSLCAVIGLSSVFVFACADAKGDTERKASLLSSEEPQCTNNGFRVQSEHAVLHTDTQEVEYRVATASTTPFDRMTVIMRAKDGSSQTPGVYELANATVDSCSACVFAFKDCRGLQCEKAFFADVGRVEILALGNVGDPFAGALRNVVFREVEVDSDLMSATPVQDGDTWCGRNFTFNVKLSAEGPSPSCLSSGTGKKIGDNIANFALQNCNGETIDLHSKCGEPKALWLMAVAGWCPACSRAVPQAAQAVDRYRANGLDLMVVLGEDEQYNPPTLEYCKQYAEEHAIDPALVYIDHDGSPWGTLFTNVSPYAEQSLAIPWNAVLRGSNMEYVYADEQGSDLSTAIRGLLSE